MSCIFCKIAAAAVPAAVIHESSDWLAFLDRQPCAPGHTIIIPKAHLVNLLELKPTAGAELLATTQAVINLLTPALGTTDFTIGINEGPLAGRAIEHLHLHLIPRFANDGGGSLHSVVQNPGPESVEAVYSRITAQSGQF